MQNTGTLIYIVILVVAFYLLIIRPQQVRTKQMRDLVAALSTGDRVITAGGIHGTVVKVLEDTVVLRMYDTSEIEFEKLSIGRIVTDIPPLPEDVSASAEEPGTGQDAGPIE